MDNRYLFRGKRVDNGEWAYGYYVNCKYQDKSETGHFIFEYPNTRHEIYTSTLGQYTGLKDKNDKLIFEGDTVRVADGDDEISELNSDTGVGVVEWLDKWGFWNISRIENSLGDISNFYSIEIIGNIHENPELLEGSGENV